MTEESPNGKLKSFAEQASRLDDEVNVRKDKLIELIDGLSIEDVLDGLSEEMFNKIRVSLGNVIYMANIGNVLEVEVKMVKDIYTLNILVRGNPPINVSRSYENEKIANFYGALKRQW